MKNLNWRGVVAPAALGVFLLPLGCPFGNGGNGSNFDGEWRITSPTQGVLACIAISNNVIAEYFDGCSGSSQPLQNAQQGAVSGNQVIWSVRVLYPGQGDVMIDQVYNVTLQADGTFSGDRTQTIIAGGMVGTPDTSPILMTPI